MFRRVLCVAFIAALTLSAGAAYAGQSAVTCFVQSTPDVPSNVVIKNDGAGAIAQGAKYTWTVGAKSEAYTFAAPLPAGGQVVLSHVLGSGQTGTCSIKATLGTVSRKQAGDVKEMIPVTRGGLTCSLQSTPDVPSNVVLKNSGPMVIPQGAKFIWTVGAKTGNYTFAAPLAVGEQVVLSHVLGSGQTGTCSVKPAPKS